MKTQTKSKKVNKAWLHDHLNDTYVKLAQKDGYRARAAYKLKEIDEELHLLKPGQVVVDLGAVPGAWSQYVRRKFAPKEAGVGGAAVGSLNGTIIALDVLDFEPIEGVIFIQGDFREDAVLAELEALVAGRPVDVVVSDMAPNLSGIEASDAARMENLVELAVDFAQKHLTPRGRAGLQGVPRQRLQPARQAVQDHLPGRQADQAEGLARQVGRDLSGRDRAEGPAWRGVSDQRDSVVKRTNRPIHACGPRALQCGRGS